MNPPTRLQTVLRSLRGPKHLSSLEIALSTARVFSSLHGSEQQLKEWIQRLVLCAPTEPAMHNAVEYICRAQADLNRKDRTTILGQVEEYFHDTAQHIIANTVTLLESTPSVMTIGRSPGIAASLIVAHKHGATLRVECVQNSPWLDGNILAKELTNKGICATIYADTALREAIKESDIILLNADAMMQNGTVIAKMGSDTACQLAHYYQIPVYVTCYSWKVCTRNTFLFDRSIEQRYHKKLIAGTQSMLPTRNHAFEIIDPMRIKGIISEFGICTPNEFISQTLQSYPWIKR